MATRETTKEMADREQNTVEFLRICPESMVAGMAGKAFMAMSVHISRPRRCN